MVGKIIKVSNLIKNYGTVEAVKNISFEVEKGSLFAFLGTNGAGKSTTIDILSTLITKNSGRVIINDWELGKDDQKIRKDIGVVFQNSVLDNLLTVGENLSIRGSFYGLSGSKLNKRIKEVSEITQCDDFIDRRFGKLSGGQKRRADIARALINQPKILFLDEPTTGLDPKSRTSIWSTIGEMQKQLGMTVFLTTHYMEEAANADIITIIDKGQIVAEGTPYNLKEKYTDDLLKIYDVGNDVIQYLNEKNIPHKVSKDVVSVIIKTADSAINILADLRDSITSFEMIHGNMDDVFLKAIGQSQEEAEC
jgi:multidrug/hemolysin transport system ATP-binding protein